MIKDTYFPLNNNVAVIITCYNRLSKTIFCLERLFENVTDLDVFLVDDGSTDGTGVVVSGQFPQVNIIQGTGNLFWNRGMHLAWEMAAQKNYDFYLWLNDDVVLYDNCIEELLSCSNLKENKAIISGIIETFEKDEILYGGTDKNKKLITPNGDLNPITNMNGNVVLVPKSVFKILGNLDPVYHHDFGDVDYGWRALKNNIGVYTTRIAIARGEKNILCRVRQNNTTLLKRFKKLYSPLGSNPAINFYSKRKKYGLFYATLYYCFLHLINIIPDYLNERIFGNKYK